MAKVQKIFVISPVRKITQEQREYIAGIVKLWKAAGLEVYWPLTDTDQNDRSGLRICQDNARALAAADAVFVYWDPSSTGSLFDLGMAFALGKKITLSVRTMPGRTLEKSFNNVLRDWEMNDQEVDRWGGPADLT